jgi:hypothetical protein
VVVAELDQETEIASGSGHAELQKEVSKMQEEVELAVIKLGIFLESSQANCQGQSG